MRKRMKYLAWLEGLSPEDAARYKEAKLLSSTIRWVEVPLRRMHLRPHLTGKILDILDALAFEYHTRAANHTLNREWSNPYHRSVWELLRPGEGDPGWPRPMN